MSTCPTCNGTGALEPRACEVCSVVFDPKTVNSRWCSVACKAAGLKAEYPNLADLIDNLAASDR